MKHRFTTSLRSQIGSQMSGQQQLKAVQNDQRCKHQQARFWHPYFWDAQDILFIDYLEKGRTINSELLVHLKEGIANEEKVLFHQDNAWRHKSIATMAKLYELQFELLPHPCYSPDLAPNDNWLFYRP